MNVILAIALTTWAGAFVPALAWCIALVIERFR